MSSLPKNQASLNRHPRVHQTVELPFTCDQLFDLVADIESYPLFLPHWRSARIVRREADTLYVEQEVGLPLPLLRFRFHSIATLECPHRLHIRTLDGPVGNLEICWQFGRVSAKSSRVTFTVHMDRGFGAQKTLISHVVENSSKSLLDHFAARAHAMYDQAR